MPRAVKNFFSPTPSFALPLFPFPRDPRADDPRALIPFSFLYSVFTPGALGRRLF